MRQGDKELLLSGDKPDKPVKAKDASNRVQAVQKIIRHSFRVPWGEEDDGFVTLRGKRFELMNVGSHGIGIACLGDEFYKGQKLSGIGLTIGEASMQLNGEVIHVSPDTEGGFLCGIRLHNLSRIDEKNIREALEKKCKEMFPKAE